MRRCSTVIVAYFGGLVKEKIKICPTIPKNNKYYKIIIITIDFSANLLYNITILYFYAQKPIYKQNYNLQFSLGVC